MKRITFFITILVTIIVTSSISYIFGQNKGKENAIEATSVKVTPTPTIVQTRVECKGASDCNSMYATNVAYAIAQIRLAENNKDLDISPKENTIMSQITVYCTNDNKCWKFDNKIGKIIQ